MTQSSRGSGHLRGRTHGEFHKTRNINGRSSRHVNGWYRAAPGTFETNNQFTIAE